MERVITYFKQYKNIYLVGHSFGGPTILLSQHDQIKAVVLWDPSFDILTSLSKDMKFDERIKQYILKWGTEYLLSTKMVESWKGLGLPILKQFKRPTKIICSKLSGLYKQWANKIKLIPVEYEFKIIKNAGHCFDETDTEQVLFGETLKWFKNH